MPAPIDVQKELIKGIIHIARHKEFYGHVIQQFQKVYVRKPHNIDTAAVGRFPSEKFIKLWLNLDYFEGIIKECGKEAWNFIVGAEEHEILHIVCFPAGTMVSGAFQPIEELAVGSAIIGSDGRCHPAARVMSRDYDGRLVKIKATGVLAFEPTEDHPVLVADIGWKTINTSSPRRNVRLIRSVDWKKSQDVKSGDWLAVPKVKGFRDDSAIDLDPYIKGNRWSMPGKIREGQFVLNEDTAWLMGLYCAEGSSDPIDGGVVFSLNRDEETLGVKVQSVVNRYVGSCCHATYTYTSEGGMVVGFCSASMARMFKDKIGGSASTKRIPDEIFWHRDDRIVKAFLRGYFDGDGTTESIMFSCATVSRALAYQVQALFARFDIWMPMEIEQLSKRPAKVIVSGSSRYCKDQYKLMSGGDEARMLLGYCPVKEKNRKTKHYTSNEEFIFVQVKSVSRRSWKGKVYNLTSPTEDYLVNNVVVHNCGHLTLHFDDRIRGNVAKDCAVNSHLLDNQIYKNWCTPQMYGMPKSKSAVWYYQNLKDNQKFQQQMRSGAFGAGGVMEHVGKSHQLWEEVEKDPVAKEFIKDILRKAKELCNKNYGNIPGEIIEMIEELLKREKPVIPWGHVLRMFCASATESNLEYTMRRESKRFGTRPGTRKEDVLNLAVCVDTSGSISDQQLVLFFNEIRWIWKNGAIVTVIEADADVQATYKFKGKFNGEVHGRGGTDLEPALRQVERKYDACIYFTDFYAPPISRQYRIPTLWVLTTDLEKNDYPAKWGRHIKIEDGQAKVA